jgi:S1-C subfamily serine protease
VVDIETVLGDVGARAAGTGMILTSDGEVMTNKHVVAGETSMRVTVVATGRTYPATVVGTSALSDVAVIRLQGASGLQPVRTTSQPASAGDAVVGVGNAEGLGGTPSAAAGHVIALDQNITAMNEDGGGAERLTGLIETDAPIAPGDSGGPLFNSSDEVLGMDTAGTAGGAPDAFAIPIAAALTATKQLVPGSASPSGSNRTSAGRQAYLGVEVTDGFGGPAVLGVAGGSPAAAAGLTPGDTITSVGGRRTPSTDALSSVMASLSPGQRIALTWTGEDGQRHRSSAALAGVPAA